MHSLRCQPASPDLRPFVRAYAQREFLDLLCPLSEPVPARLEQTLEFQFGEPLEVFVHKQCKHSRPIHIVGSYTEGRCVVTLKKKVISFGVFFQPTGLSRLFRISPVEFSNQDYDALDVLPNGIRHLHDQLAACPSFSSRVVVVEQFLRSLVARVSVRNEFGRDAAARIFQVNGVVRLRELAADYGISVRQLERRFRQSVGITPKVYARVARFQTALDAKLLRPQLSWLSIAHDLGYHDQMHMVHDFHELAGAAPNEILATVRDGRPPAMKNFSQF